MNDKPLSHFRLLLSPIRSGSSVLLRALCQHGKIKGFYQPFKQQFRDNKPMDFTPYDPECEMRQDIRYRNKFLLFKETLGPYNEAECTLKFYPNDQALADAHPIFLFRDPRTTYVAWKATNLGTPELFILAYRTLYEEYLKAIDLGGEEGCVILTYERFTGKPEETLRQVCRFYGIEFDPRMLTLQRSLSQCIENRIDPKLDDNPKLFDKLHQNAETSTSIQKATATADSLTPEELEIIEGALYDTFRDIKKRELAGA